MSYNMKRSPGSLRAKPSFDPSAETTRYNTRKNSGALRPKPSFDPAGETTDCPTDVDADFTDYGETTDCPSIAPETYASDSEKAALPTAAWGKPAPEGGLTAWLVILGAWCTSFCSFGWINAVGTFQEYYQQDMLRSYSASTISWIPSLQIFFIMGLGPFIGIIYDRYGPRWLLLVGSVLHVFGIMMTSLGTEYYQILLSQGVCSSLGAACIFQPSMNCIAGWFDKKRGLAFGILFTGSSVGGIVFPILVSHLIAEVGFAWAMRTCGFLVLFLLIIANLTIKPFNPPYPKPVSGRQLLQPLKEVDFLLLAAGVFCFSYGFFAPINYLPVAAISGGMSPDLAQYLLSILNAGSLFGRLLAGIFADKIGRYNIYTIVCYFSGLWILALWLPDTTDAAIVAFAVLFGFFSGAFVSLITPLILAISPFQELGFRTGMIMFATALAGLTTNPINGAIIDGAGGWNGLKIFSGVFCLLGSTLVFMVRLRRTGLVVAARF